MRLLAGVLFLTLLTLISNSYQQSNPSQYNFKCPGCMLNIENAYFCTLSNECRTQFQSYQSCEQGLHVCMAYRSTDLGVYQLAPYNQTSKSFKHTLLDGESVRFAISNQDPERTAWMGIQASENNNETLPYTSAQPHMVLLYYNPLVLDERSEYIYSRSGRSYIKPLDTFQFYFAADGGDYTFYVKYGNT